jgi:hypothetical protein
MVSMKDNAITPHRGRFEQALKRLPAAHIQAQRHAVSHLHSTVRAAASAAGMDPEPIGVYWKKGEAYLGLGFGEAATRVGDQEFGTPEQAPNPVLRSTHRRAMPQAKGIYAHRLVTGLGF